MKVDEKYFQFLILAISVTSVVGFYLMADYYMNPDTSAAFGGSCGEVVEDASMYVNSHINPLKWFSYGPNKDCMLTLDAGSMGGALFKVTWIYFDLEYSSGCTKDYLKLYNANQANIDPSNLINTFCGNLGSNVNFTTPSQRYLTLVWHVDGSGTGDGFRLRATRTEPSPCQSDEFHCTLEDLCIDERLKCDGTNHCDDNLDESDCSFFEELIGSIIALGMGGIVGVSIAFIGGCVGIWTLVCVFTCCKKCCSLCCTKCCCFWPCCKGRTCGRAGRVDPDDGYPDAEQGDYPVKKTADNNDIKIQETDENGDEYFDDDLGGNKVKITGNKSSTSLRSLDKTQTTGVGQTNGGYMADVGY